MIKNDILETDKMEKNIRTFSAFIFYPSHFKYNKTNMKKNKKGGSSGVIF